ncbi:MAG: O-antigen ligase family protein [Thermoleophilia bacterium]|nr:O-antigen ligase family protein [Thermoleophilia bacterium]
MLLAALAGWAVLAAAGGGMDYANGAGGAGPLAAFLGLAVAAPLAAVALWRARHVIGRGGAAGLALWCGLGLVALGFLSIAWAVDPSAAWIAGNRMALLGCGLVLGLAAGAAVPGAAARFPVLLSAAAVVPVGLALLTEALPGLLGQDGAGARLAAPVDYPNALALIAAAAVPGAVAVAGSPRRWAAPASAAWMTCLAAAAVLTLSRSGIAVTGVALCLSLALGPRARAGAGAAAAGALGAAPAVLVGLLTHDLSADGLAADDRAGAGAVFGLVLIGGAGAAAVLARPAQRAARSLRVPRPRLVLGVVAAVLALAPLAVVAADHGAITGCGGGAVSNSADRLTNAGANQRGAWWCQAARGWEAHPLRGNGAGSFPLVQRRERENGNDRVLTLDPHQVFLAPASDLGSLGLALMLGLWAAGGLALLRLRRAAPAGLVAILAAAGVQSLTDWTLTWPASGLPVAAALGLLAASAVRGPGPRALSGGGEAALVAALAAAAIAAPVAAGLPWWSGHLVRSSQDALARGDLGQALSRAREARSRNPLSIDPLRLRALALARGGDRAGAEAALREATRLQPDNPMAWRALARFMGTGEAARGAWVRVHLLDPYASDARAALLIPDDAPPGIARGGGRLRRA